MSLDSRCTRSKDCLRLSEIVDRYCSIVAAALGACVAVLDVVGNILRGPFGDPGCLLKKYFHRIDSE